jgi:8-oxo-dGTP diphosphatase
VSRPQRITDIDWGVWTPTDPATLVFIIRDQQMLLIRKKRGLGAGKINGPGGRMEPGETALQCAIREVQEELCVTPLGMRYAGENRFQFVDGYGIHVKIFRAADCSGIPRETAEAVPVWVPLDAIPFAEMWEDDALWIPLLLQDRLFSGRFVFDGERMLDHHIDIEA